MIQAESLLKFAEIKHFFLNREESGSKEISEMTGNALTCQQVHGKNIIKTDGRKFYAGCDGLLTQESQTLLIKTADCLPVFFYFPEKKFMAGIHAGWRGLRKGIIKETAELFFREGIKTES